MSDIYSWIYIDHTNHIWKFFINDDKKLCYRIMYEEGKWTKESIIDRNVLGFSLCLDNSETIHIIYSNIRGEVKYCTLKDKQWMGNLIYCLERDSDKFKIYDVKMEVMANQIHIFCILKDSNESGHGLLVHLIWDGNVTEAVFSQDIILASNIKETYTIKADEDGNIYMIYVTDEGDETSINYCLYEKGEWVTKRLYGIYGDEIAVEVFKEEQGIHILNKYKDDSLYFLDHVRIDMSGAIEDFKVYESAEEVREPFLFIENNQLYAWWLEKNKIYYSAFNGEAWNPSQCVERQDKGALCRYHCYLVQDHDGSIERIEVYGGSEADLHLFLPNKFIFQEEMISNSEGSLMNKGLHKNKALEKLEIQLCKIKSENKTLYKTIASLNEQLQVMKRSVKDYQGQMAKSVKQIQKSDENSKLFIELQEKLQKELTDIKDLLLKEQDLKTVIEVKLKECQEENMLLKEEIEELKKEKQESKQEEKKLDAELELEENKISTDELHK